MKKKLLSLLITVPFITQNAPIFNTTFDTSLETDYNEDEIEEPRAEASKSKPKTTPVIKPKSTSSLPIPKPTTSTTNVRRKLPSLQQPTISPHRAASRQKNIMNDDQETTLPNSSKISKPSSGKPARNSNSNENPAESSTSSSKESEEKFKVKTLENNSNKKDETKINPEKKLEEMLKEEIEEIEETEDKYLANYESITKTLSAKNKEQTEIKKEVFEKETLKLKNEIDKLRILNAKEKIQEIERDFRYQEQELFEEKKELIKKINILRTYINEIKNYKWFFAKELLEKHIIINPINTDEIFKYKEQVILIITFTTWKKFEDIIKDNDKNKSLKEIENIVINFKQQNYQNHLTTKSEIKPLIEMIYDNFITYSMLYQKTQNETIKIFKELNTNELLYEDSEEIIVGNPNYKETIQETKKHIETLKQNSLELINKINDQQDVVTKIKEGIIEIKTLEIEAKIDYEILKNEIYQKEQPTEERKEHISGLNEIKSNFFALKKQYTNALNTYSEIKQTLQSQIKTLEDITHDIKKQKKYLFDMFEKQEVLRTTVDRFEKSSSAFSRYYTIKVTISSTSWTEIANWFFSYPYKQRVKTPLASKLYNMNRANSYYGITREDITSITRLIFDHFPYYYDKYMKIKDDPNKAIEITSYSDYENGYWYEQDPDYYNKIVAIQGGEKHPRFQKLSIANEKREEIKKAEEKAIETKEQIKKKTAEFAEYKKRYRQEVDKFKKFIIHYQITLSEQQFLDLKEEVAIQKTIVEQHRLSWQNSQN